jgi:ankyrin repeat protein
MGANIKTDKNHKGANALLLVAPYLKNFDLVTFLLSQGASLQDTDNNGDGLFAYAAKGGNVKFLKTLIKKRIATGENAMIFASQGLRRKKNSLETYKFLESVGVKPNAVDTSGRNSLHAIAYNNKDLATYSYFISRGTDVNLQDHEGNTPFMNAANSNTLKVIKYLSKTVKDINLKDANGRSALTKAVQRNTLDVVAFLLVQKADINSLDDKGNSLSYYLIQTFDAKNLTNFEEKRALLEKNGLVINSPQNSGNTLLHIATSKDNLALLKRLSSFNINVNKQNEDGLSALQIAAMTSKNIDIINYLISIGAHKNIKTAFGETIYDLALENEILMKNNIDLHFLK